MLSSLIWLILLQAGYIDSEHAPWYIYIPVVTVELFAYFITLPKFLDWIDRRKHDKDHD